MNKNFASLAIQTARSEDSDQTVRMRRPIEIFTVRTKSESMFSDVAIQISTDWFKSALIREMAGWHVSHLTSYDVGDESIRGLPTELHVCAVILLVYVLLI